MSSPTAAFSSVHRLYVKSLYRRYLKNTLDWTIRRDIWRGQALQIRAEFDANRNVTDPRALATILQEAEARLANMKHPDPYISELLEQFGCEYAQMGKAPTAPNGTKWERNLPPSMEPLYDHEAHPAH